MTETGTVTGTPTSSGGNAMPVASSPVLSPMQSASAVSAAVPISPGSQQVSVSVTVGYAV